MMFKHILAGGFIVFEVAAVLITGVDNLLDHDHNATNDSRDEGANSNKPVKNNQTLD